MKANNYELENISPLVRGRIVSINDKEFARDDGEYFSREDQGAKAIKNRSLNLSYRKELSKSETIIEGEFPTSTYDYSSNKDIEISLEFRYARRLGVKLGDRIKIEIQGLDFDTVVTSIRKIKWTSFQPNFFIQFQDGAINDAPKIFISSMRVESEQERRNVQNLIVKKFSNISSVDISKVIEEVLKLMTKMSYILMIMVLLVSISGVLVVIAINYQQFLARRTDIKLLKLIGTPLRTIITIPLIESLLLAVAANLLGVCVGLLSSFVLAKFVCRRCLVNKLRSYALYLWDHTKHLLRDLASFILLRGDT